jgi:hypothetical protein
MDASATIGIAGGYIALTLTVAGSIYAAVNHKHIRSSCCGKKAEISLDIDTVTPANTTVQVQLPAQYQPPPPA